ncbi:low molecular weight protein arginine phosphatase [Alteribacter populi]|uniref:low molecular weight protein arginine phosphatase n=1 Tax=Alteribacter populi TaxID=2011011 RepID=UPI0012FDAB35|nr:low molecular weight protein arginine phosphatase [Alteribacter populi]
MKKVLFVCTGNTCRSPLAEAIFKEKTKGNSIGFEARSAGIHAMEGMPISEGSKAALQERGLAHDHQSQSVTPKLLDWADIVLTMTQGHKRRIIELFPERHHQVYTFNEFVNDDPDLQKNKEKLDHELAQLEMKRAQFLTENQGKIDQYNANKGINKQQNLKRKLLDEIKPHQEAIDELTAKLPSEDIADPFGGDKAIYLETLAEVEAAMDKLIKKLT